MSRILLVVFSLFLLGGCPASHQYSEQQHQESRNSREAQKRAAIEHCFNMCQSKYEAAAKMCKRTTASIYDPADEREAFADCLEAKNFPLGENTCNECYKDIEFHKKV